MSLPFGYRYLDNMALYIHKGLRQSYIDDYGENLENHYDEADNTLCKDRIFCFDCFYFETCKGRCWEGCPHKAKALKIIRG